MQDKSGKLLELFDQLGIEGVQAGLRSGEFGNVADPSNWRSTMAMQWIKDNRESRALSLASESAASANAAASSASEAARWAKWAAIIAAIAAISANAGLIQELIAFVHSKLS